MAIQNQNRSAIALLLGLSIVGCDASTNTDGTTPSAADEEAAPSAGAQSADESASESGPAAAAEEAPAAEGQPADEKPVTAAVYRNVRGSVSESGGGHHPELGLGGLGSISAAVKVKVTALLETGLGETLCDGDIGKDGSFSLSLPVDVKLAVVDAVDLEGNIVGSVLLALDAAIDAKVDLSVDLGAAVKLAPITAETSLEVRVLREALDCPCTTAGAGNAISLALAVAANIDARVTAALDAALGLGLDLDVALSGLAKGILAAHEARITALVDAGVSIDLDAMVEAELKALVDLQADLVACAGGLLTLDDVSVKLQAALDAALSVAGALDASLRVRAHVAASVALGGALSAVLDVVAGLDLSALLDATLHASLCVEAKVAADAVVALLVDAGAPKATIDAAIAAGLKLVADVNLAVDLKAAVDARVKFVDTLCGKDGKVGLLGAVTGLVGGLLGTVTGLLGSLSAQLDAALSVNLDAVAKAPICIAPAVDVGLDVNASVDLALSGIVGTLVDFCGDVKSELSLNAGASVDVDLLAQVLATAQLVARVSL